MGAASYHMWQTCGCSSSFVVSNQQARMSVFEDRSYICELLRDGSKFSHALHCEACLYSFFPLPCKKVAGALFPAFVGRVASRRYFDGRHGPWLLRSSISAGGMGRRGKPAVPWSANHR